MSRIGRIIALFILALGPTGFALAGSLDLPPASKDTSVAPYSLEGAQFAKATKPKVMKEVPTQSANLFEDSGMWMQFYTGYDFSLMGDVASGTDAWAKYAKSLGDTVSGGGNNSGVMASYLWGFKLDKSNSLALDLGSVFTFPNNWAIQTTSGVFAQNLGPYFLSASLDYILDIAQGPGNRLYLTAGLGYYHGVVDYTLNAISQSTSGSFTGDTIGGTLGVGQEMDLGNSFGLDCSIRLRYASFGRMSTDHVLSTSGPTPGTYSLAIATQAGYGLIIPDTNGGIDGSAGAERYAGLDYSGIDAKVALNFYFQ